MNTGPLYQGEEIPSQGGAQGSSMNRTFRIHRYPTDYPGFAGYDLVPMGPIELYMNTYTLTYLPNQFKLLQNFPNPFNPQTTIRYHLPENIFVNITIYDLLGKKVKTLVNHAQFSGPKSVIWNAKDDHGERVGAGIFLYQIQAGDFIQSRKMILLK